MRNQLQDAATHLERAVKLQPKTADSHASLGMTYYKLGKVDDAERELAKAVEINPNDADLAVVTRQDLSREEGVSKRRSRTWSRRCCSIPRTRSSLSNLGVAYRQTNKMAEAEKYFTKAIELKPDQADFHFNLATVYRRQQKTQGGDRRVPEGDRARQSAGTGALRSRRAARAAQAQRRGDPALEQLSRFEGAERSEGSGCGAQARQRARRDASLTALAVASRGAAAAMSRLPAVTDRGACRG